MGKLVFRGLSIWHGISCCLHTGGLDAIHAPADFASTRGLKRVLVRSMEVVATGGGMLLILICHAQHLSKHSLKAE